MTLAGYGLDYGTGALWPDSPRAKSLRLPVVGGWIYLANAGCGAHESGCDAVPVVARSVFATLGALLQIGGIGIALEGVLMETEDSEPAPSELAASVISLPGGAGLMLHGGF